jgi:hypothetical protein
MNAIPTPMIRWSQFACIVKDVLVLDQRQIILPRQPLDRILPFLDHGALRRVIRTEFAHRQ